MKSCEICFKRESNRNGVCNVCHGVAEATVVRRDHTVRNADLTDEWAQRFLHDVQAAFETAEHQIAVAKTQAQGSS